METLSRYRNLRLLWWLRNIAIAGQAGAILVVTHGLGIELPTTPLSLILLAMVGLNLATWWRIKTTNQVSDGEFFAQLCLDMLALFGLLYFTGGATNSFTSLFILQVVIAAITLPAIYSWIAAGISIALYTILMFWSVEVPHFMHHGGSDFFSLHVQGMWISFILLAGIVAWFVVRMNTTIRRQHALLAEAETMAALGTLATSAAHELGTPLAIMALLAEECDAPTTGRFSEQISRCKSILSRITAAGGVMRAEGGAPMKLSEFLQSTAARWQNEQESGRLQSTIGNGVGDPVIIAEYSLQQALLNLLNNAAEASPETVRLEATWDAHTLTIQIHDNGDGIPDTLRPTLGTAGVTTKTHGLGLGLFLSKSVVARLEGSLELQNRSPHGITARVTLPLRRLSL